MFCSDVSNTQLCRLSAGPLRRRHKASRKWACIRVWVQVCTQAFEGIKNKFIKFFSESSKKSSATSDIVIKKSCACLYTGENDSRKMWPSGAFILRIQSKIWDFFFFFNLNKDYNPKRPILIVWLESEHLAEIFGAELVLLAKILYAATGRLGRVCQTLIMH